MKRPKSLAFLETKAAIRIKGISLFTGECEETTFLPERREGGVRDFPRPASSLHNRGTHVLTEGTKGSDSDLRKRKNGKEGEGGL